MPPQREAQQPSAAVAGSGADRSLPHGIAGSIAPEPGCTPSTSLRGNDDRAPGKDGGLPPAAVAAHQGALDPKALRQQVLLMQHIRSCRRLGDLQVLWARHGHGAGMDGLAVAAALSCAAKMAGGGVQQRVQRRQLMDSLCEAFLGHMRQGRYSARQLTSCLYSLGRAQHAPSRAFLRAVLDELGRERGALLAAGNAQVRAVRLDCWA